MHPILSAAEQYLRRAASWYADPERLPSLVDVSLHRDEYREVIIFTVTFSDGSSTRWCVPLLMTMDPPPWMRSARGLLFDLGGMWDRLRMERRQGLLEMARLPDPPRMADPAIDDDLARLRPDGIVEYVQPRAADVRPTRYRPNVRIWEAFRRVIEGTHQAVPSDCPMCNPDGAASGHRKAIQLLREWLSPAQLEQFNKNRCFDVIGSEVTR